MTPTYTLLLVTVLLSFFSKSRLILWASLGLTTAFAFREGVIDYKGLAILGGIAGLTYALYAPSLQRSVLYFPLALCLFALGIAIGGHLLPGFHNLPVLNKVQFSPNAHPYTLYFNFDKTMLGLLIFAFSPLFTTERLPTTQALIKTAEITLLCIVCLFIPAYALGYIAFDPKLPSTLGVWALNNLFFVCVAEEIFFRGFVQTTFASNLKRFSSSPVLPILLTSILFGLAHYKGGTSLMILAGGAGLFYGTAYARTNSILCATLVHFGLNLAHFLLFTYPAMR